MPINDIKVFLFDSNYIHCLGRQCFKAQFRIMPRLNHFIKCKLIDLVKNGNF